MPNALVECELYNYSNDLTKEGATRLIVAHYNLTDTTVVKCQEYPAAYVFTWEEDINPHKE